MTPYVFFFIDQEIISRAIKKEKEREREREREREGEREREREID